MSYPKKQRITVAKNTLMGRLYTPAEAALYLGVAMQSLAHWRCQGKGPQYCCLTPRMIRYPESALKEWVGKRTRDCTAENDKG